MFELKKNSALFNMISNSNQINSNQFEQINCNDWLHQTRLAIYQMSKNKILY